MNIVHSCLSEVRFSPLSWEKFKIAVERAVSLKKKTYGINDAERKVAWW